MNNTEIKVNTDGQERTRVCLTCDLKNDPALISEYLKYHSPEHHWPEIMEGIKASGVEVMDIYLVDNRMFMICEVPVSMSIDDCWEKMGVFPRQSEWAELMSKFQQAVPGHPLEWVKMERVFTMR